MAAAAAAERQLAALFRGVYAAAGWHPKRRYLAELLSNATALLDSCSGCSGGHWDTADLAAVLLEAACPSAAAATSGDGIFCGSFAEKGPNDPGSGGPVDITWWGLLLGALVIGINGLISVWLRLGLHGKLAVATVRCG